MEATLDVNSGGRVRFDLDAEVRILQLDGTISPEVYRVAQERSDRKGHLTLQERGGSRTVKVHHRRVLPLSVEGRAVVIESSDKFWALCPECGQVSKVGTGDESYTCQHCTKSFPLHWLGVRPMAETAEKADKAAKKKDKPAATKAAAPKTEKAPKAVKEPVKVDVSALAKLKNCELWTKKNVKFDHERIDVQAHCLLFTSGSPRKLCFNTYNATLGKKATELPIDAFLKGETVKGAKKDTPWFPVPDLEKARQKLQKDGYERHS